MQKRNLASLFLAILAFAAAAPGYTEAAPPTPLTLLTPILYNNVLVKSFLSEYLGLSEVQMLQADVVIAETRAKLYPLNEKLKGQQRKLDAQLVSPQNPQQARQQSEAATQQLIQAIAQTQARILSAECSALQRFYTLLDGDQRHKLSRVTDLSIISNPQTGQPALAYKVEQ